MKEGGQGGKRKDMKGQKSKEHKKKERDKGPFPWKKAQ